ncbi:MAG: ArsR/SmtB family transcription factor [Sphingomonadales bacterium]
MESAIQALSALAQDSRLRVFRLLVQQGPDGMAAGDIARELDLPASTLSTHLSVLSNAGLVASTRHSRSIVYAIDVAAMRDLLGFLVEDCCRGRPEVCTPLLDSVMAGCCAPEESADCCSPSSNGALQ